MNKMDIKLIKTEADYQAALVEIERLFDAMPGTPEGDQLDIWTALVEHYEDRQHPVPLPDPIEAITYHIESRGLTRRELGPYLGSRARRRGAQSAPSADDRHDTAVTQRLGIAAEVLIQPYPLRCAA